jgi:putative transcriptional regulator
MTQDQLAAKVGITRAYLARIETGRHEPSLKTLERLARVLKVTLPDLVR